jgi:DNA polymerase III alpha subunit
MKEALLRSREGRSVFRDPFLTKILPETAGLLLYEEQVMQIAERVAGLPPEEGDLLRRNLKKKGADFPLKKRFFTEAGERGYTPGSVKKLWKVMEEFSSYSFNKAHSASYAHMAYQAVYLKAHFPLVYLTSVLNAGGGYYGLAEYIEEAKRRKIRILGPDVNRSGYQFEVEDKSIRVGLLSIKGLALKTAEKIINERESGAYLSIEDFLIRVSLSKAELFPLIQAGAFDSLEPRRTQQILRYFRGLEGMGNVSDLSLKQKERMVVESLGFDPEGDSLSLYIGKRPPLRIEDLIHHAGCEVELLVRVVDARLKGTANGRKYFFLFEDETGLLEGVGGTKGLTFGSPPACYLRGEVKKDGNGRPKIFDCTFLKP